MDSIVAESSDVMVNSLNFGLPETAQYITGRRLVNYFPSGSNVYAPNAGNKNLRYLISGSDNEFLDLSSIRLFATLQNTDADRAKFLRPLAGLHAFFSRYRCTIGGQQCQDIIEYARHCELFNCFQSKDVLLQATTTGATNAGGVVTVSTGGDRNEFGRIDKRYTRHSLCGIPGAQGKARFSHKPCCGIVGHGGKYYH